MSQVSEDDLLVAADWLQSYDGGSEGDETERAMYRVAAYLRQEADRVADRALRAHKARRQS